ncbi:hypothetical protein [Lysobacter capsici]|uniref:hypothetical protein n=1 Tax=Lysobacter capsici TaxID=435897 RepID=UPI00287BAFB8|nr:hypothetical protein [Lysobacter capsici]WND80442.1 hypothetical protein RJ610_24730 [Lysobacter capsici]WND85639.1 hypothetical protein RJ609_24750 [Lysobacter capsici]
MKPINAILATLVLTSCTAVPTKPNGALTPSMLNAERSEYHGQRVKVFGWMTSSFERYGLWESRAVFDRGDYAHDCVSLLIPESMDTSFYNKRYVELDGNFIQQPQENTVNLGACNETTIILSEGSPPKLIK